MEICATAMVILVAGFDTTSSALTFAAYELAVNPDIQRRLQEEIDDLATSPDDVDYHTVQEMPYLDMVAHETLRKYPIAPAMTRAAAEAYTLPGTQWTVPKGTIVVINAAGIQHDERYYPEPERFDPERFSKEEKAKRDP